MRDTTMDLARLLRDRVIEEGIASVNRLETQEHKKRGCLEGFRIAGELEIPEGFTDTITERRRVQQQMFFDQVDPETYWEHTCCTAQIEFVWERLRIVLGQGSEMVSGNAVVQIHRILGDEVKALADADAARGPVRQAGGLVREG
jgi:hypothetical protein